MLIPLAEVGLQFRALLRGRFYPTWRRVLLLLDSTPVFRLRLRGLMINTVKLPWVRIRMHMQALLLDSILRVTMVTCCFIKLEAILLLYKKLWQGAELL